MQYYNDQDIAAAGFATSSDAATHLTLLTAEQLEQRLGYQRCGSGLDQASGFQRPNPARWLFYKAVTP